MPNVFYISAEDGETISLDVVKSYDKQMNNTERWKTFEEFHICAFGLWKVNLVRDKDNWLSSTFTCPAYQKNLKCKHIIGIAMHVMKYDVVYRDRSKAE